MTNNGRGRPQKYTSDDILRLLDDEGRLGTDEIAEKLECHRTTANNRLSDLEKEGYVSSKKVGNSNMWEYDREPNGAVIPINGSEDMYRRGIKNRIEIARDTVPDSMIPEELEGKGPTNAWVFSEEESDIFEKFVYGDYIIFYYKYPEKVSYSGCQGSILSIAKVNDRITDVSVSSYLFPELDEISKKHRKSILFDDVLSGLIPRTYITEYLELGSDPHGNAHILEELTDDLDSSQTFKMTDSMQSLLGMNLGMSQSTLKTLVRGRGREHIEKEFISEFVDEVYERNPQLMRDYYLEPHESYMDNSANPETLDLLIPQTHSVLTTNLICDIDAETNLVQISYSTSEEKLFSLIFDILLYDKLNSANSTPALVSMPPMTPFEEMQLKLLEEICDQLDVDLYVYQRDF